MAKVSIITPCYNGERFLRRTIESVRVQTFTDWEQIIVDDGSTDRSAEIAVEFAAKDHRIRVLRQENRGVSCARNTGFKAASHQSDYLLFLDADDTLRETMLSTLACYMDAHAEVGLAYCDFVRIDEQDQEIGHDDRPPRLKSAGRKLVPLASNDPDTPFDTMLWWLWLPPSTALMRRSVYEHLPGWDECFAHSVEDTDFLLRFALASPVHFLPQDLVGYRRHPGQVTQRAWHMKRQRGVLHDKWLSGTGLNSDQRAAFAAQWRLYEGSLLPRYLLGEARAELRRGDLSRAVKLAVRSGAHLAIYCSSPVRRLVWPYLWYLA